MKRTELLDITLCSVDCVEPQLALESLIISSEKIKFGKVILFSDTRPLHIPSHITFVQIDKLNSLIEYSNFVLRDLNKYIETDFCLMVHADGTIHNPHLWEDEFKRWDYIGAPWPLTLHFTDKNTRVGNGGVSLRSKKLLTETSKLEYINAHEDVVICLHLKEYLKTLNINIAPLEVAGKFAIELSCEDVKLNPETECFAFHGKAYSPFHVEQNKKIKEHLECRIKNMNIIERTFNEKKNQPSDINEHMDVLHQYALKCDTIAEFGIRYVTSSYAFALAKPKRLLCLDLDTNEHVERFINECKQESINIEFVQASSLEYTLNQNYDLLFIDTLHTFDQLTQELAKHHSKVNKYIIFHDTVFWGNKNENPIDSSDTGERGENVGLVPAIKNFLKSHTNWKEVCTYTNNNGLSIIKNTDNVKD